VLDPDLKGESFSMPAAVDARPLFDNASHHLIMATTDIELLYNERIFNYQAF